MAHEPTSAADDANRLMGGANPPPTPPTEPPSAEAPSAEAPSAEPPSAEPPSAEAPSAEATTADLSAGATTVDLAPGTKTVRLTPGQKNVRLTATEPDGHVPGESTVRLAAVDNPQPPPPAPELPKYDEAAVKRVPVIPGRPAADDKTRQPAGPKPGTWPPHAQHSPAPPTSPAVKPPVWPPHAPASPAPNAPKPTSQPRQNPADVANRARPVPANDTNQVRQTPTKAPAGPSRPAAVPSAMAPPATPAKPTPSAPAKAAPSAPAKAASSAPAGAPAPANAPNGGQVASTPVRGQAAVPPANSLAVPQTAPGNARRPEIRLPEPVDAPRHPGTDTVVIPVIRPTSNPPTPPGAGETMAIRMPADAAGPLIVTPLANPAEADRAVTRLPKAPPAGSPTPSLIEPRGPRPVDSLEPMKERRRRPRANGLGQAPWILALSAFGVVLVALGYAGGRYEIRYAIGAYWIGQVLVFTPVVIRLLSRRLAGVAESFVLVLGLAFNQYMLKWFYSPDQFRFPDELQHWLGTTIINETGELFQPNLALPPAVHFPGLAEMGAGISQLTGLPVYAAGIIVAGAAHLCFVGALFALVLRSSGSPAIAGVSCVVYATTLHYLFFNSMYLYQTAALPFFMITVWAVRRWRAGGGRPFLAIAVVGIGLTTVSHHVTAVALVATLVLLGGTEYWADRSRPWRALLAPGVAAVMVAGWILIVARDVIDYLEAPLDQVMQTASMFLTDHQDATEVATPVSIWQLAVQGLGLVFLLALSLALLRDTLARAERDPWRWSILAGTAIFFAGNAVRFLGSGGPEIAGRLSTFTYVPLSVVAAIALVHAPKLIPEKNAEGKRWLAVSPLPPAVPSDRTFTPRVLAGAAIITVLMIGARVGGWPPSAQLLPGPYLAIGFERSVDAYGIEAAAWEYDMLGSGNRVGGDTVSVSLASTYGRQDPVREVGQLYYDEVWTLEDDALVDELGINYLVVDTRLSTHLPTNQAYFEGDPHAGRITKPLTTGQLHKFDALPTVSRLYDNGVIQIYRMGAT